MWKFFGLDPESIAKSEVATYDPSEGGRQRDRGDQIGDAIMYGLTGVDYTKEVKEDFGESRIKKADSVVGYDKLGDLSKYKALQLKRAIEEREATNRERNKVAVLTGQDPSEFLKYTDPGAIQAAGAGFIKDELKTEKEILRGREDARVARVEAERGRQFDNNLALQRRQIEANIQARQDNIDLSRLKLQMDQNRYMYEAESRRQDKRKERIAALTQALTGLGASFFI